MTAISVHAVDHPSGAGLLRWSASLLLVVAAHAGIAAIAVSWQVPAGPSAPPPAVLFELAPLPAAPPAVPAEVAPGPQQTVSDAAQFQSEPEIVPEPLPEPAPPAPDPEPVMEMPVQPPPVVEPVSLPEPPAVPNAEVAVNVRPKPRPRPRQAAPVPVSQPAVEQKPEPEPPAPATSAPQAVEAPAAPVAAAPVPGAAAPRLSNAIPNWQSLLLTRLEQHKRYPRQAQERRQQGVAHVRFSMDRQGSVLASTIEKSSGVRALDQEVLDLVRRAAPLPPPPSEIPGERVELVVPIQFFLR